MSSPLVIEAVFDARRSGGGAAAPSRPGPTAATVAGAAGRVPRVARLLALAHRFDALLRSGQVLSQAELARLGQVSSARVSQILQLLLLAPDLQEQVLCLPPVQRGRAPLLIADLLPIAALPNWASQRRRWQALHKANRR